MLVALWLQFRHILKSRAHNFLLEKTIKYCLLVIVVVELAPAAEMSDSQMQIRWILPEKRCKASLRFWGLGKKDEDRSAYSSMAHS